jgi:hypothetical protein
MHHFITTDHSCDFIVCWIYELRYYRFHYFMLTAHHGTCIIHGTLRTLAIYNNWLKLHLT